MRTVALLSSVSAMMLIACAVVGEDAPSTGDDLSASGRVHASDAAAPDAGSDDVRVIVEPSDDGGALVAAITAATRSVHMTMYELSAPTVINALVARHRAGVEVKVILNENFFTGGPNPNETAFTTLQSAGIPVVWAPSTFELTHEKCVVIDGHTAWIMTMNASKTSPIDNREYLAVDTNAPAVAEAEAQFAADFTGTAYTPTGPLLMSPITMRPGLAALIASATHTLDFEVEELNDYGLVNELCAAAGRHVTVRGVLSTQTLSSPGRTALAKLEGCGVMMKTLAQPYIHAKALVVDSARAYVGSANFSTTSLDDNRELGLVTVNASAVSAINTTLGTDISNAKAAGVGL